MFNFFLIILLAFFSGNSATEITSASSAGFLKNYTGKKLLLEEIRFLQNNVAFYYKRGERTKSNINFDGDYIIFDNDGKDIYHQSDGEQYELQWEFTTAAQDAINYTITSFRDGADLVVKWEKIIAADAQIQYIEYYNHANGTASLASCVRLSVCEDSFVEK
ncbi:MAG TPA: hypothetical protein PKC39_14910 [Ferruginibacter sp.]|nr:hypothetical protein [Ferruginibacter sp.]HMP22248.1 hypothetical protein [Ferruginibacter sp.]